MAIKINFDSARSPETPTLLLANRNGEKLGQIPAKNIVLKDSLNNAAEISFSVYKYRDDIKDDIWDKIVNSRLVWCKEWDTWFEITADISESDKTVKNVSCTQLAQAELSQTNLYNIEINTENDIAREDYLPTVLFAIKEETKKNSLLHRIMEKVPHYSVVHVDSTIKDIQRTFTFDGTSVYDAFQQIAEEIGCLFRFHSGTNPDGTIQRTISVYDLQSNCKNGGDPDSGKPKCLYRGEFTGKCPKCSCIDISEGFGQDTTIFLTSDELADEIQFTTDSGSVKNCFKLEAGDDDLTAAVRNCNPNGSDYIWHISEDMKSIMSGDLVEKLAKYDAEYEKYQKEYAIDLGKYVFPEDPDALQMGLASEVYKCVEKYSEIASRYNMPTINDVITGYPALMTAYYNTIDLELYLRSSMMPEVKIEKPNANEQAKALVEHFKKEDIPVAVSNTTPINKVSPATIKSAVLAMVKVIVDSRFKVEIKESQKLNTKTWQFIFTITSYSDKEDTADSDSISISLTINQETYLQQSIEKMLNKDYKDDLSISGLFQKESDAFTAELAKYCLNRLTSFSDACEACIEILENQGLDDESSWAASKPNLHETLYVPYTEKLKAIQQEIANREKDLDVATNLQDCILIEQEAIQDNLNFEKFIKSNNGEALWTEFCSYRREDKYSNSNYISDGLTNAELFERAQEFIETANNELYKSAELQHSISTSLKNLLVMEKFKPLVEHFEVGNWVRVQVDDNIYKLRMMEYEINYDELDKISVSFSDVMRIADGVSDMKSILEQTAHMSTSYSSLQRQASQNAKSTSLVKSWVEEGLDATNVKIMNSAENQTQIWDEHGMLFREYDPITDDYLDTQLKIVNSTIAITEDNWETTKTAIGAFYYPNPEKPQELIRSYGINGETLVGKLILGENLGIYNEGSSLKFDKNGLCISNQKNSFTVNPNSEKLLTLSTKDGDIFYVDAKGKLHIKGDGSGLDISTNDSIISSVKKDEFGTELVQNSESLQLSWNKISEQIQFEINSGHGSLCIYDKSKTENEQLMTKFNYTGNHFYRDGYYIGKLGTNQWNGNTSHKGLVFDLEPNGKYMAFAQRETSDSTSYTTMLCFSRENSIYDKYGIHFGCDVDGHNYTLNNFKIGSICVDCEGYSAPVSGFTGAIPIITSIEQDENGNFLSYKYSKLRVSNGIIVGYWN